MGLHQHGYSPVALDKIVTANAEVKSARSAVRVLKKLTGLTISESHLLGLSATIGEELAEQRDEQAAQHAAGQLAPEPKEAPNLAVVEVDGGRIQTRAENAARGVHEKGWKETKVGCLITMSSTPCEADPHPELPACFADRPYVEQMVRELKSLRGEASSGASPATDSAPLAEAEPAATDNAPLPETASPADASPPCPAAAPAAGPTPIEATAEKGGASSSDSSDETLAPSEPAATAERKRSKDWRPKRMVRTCVSGLCTSDEFGPQVAAEAQRRRFFEAPRKAFLGDGLAWNWTLHERHFRDFVAILDFVHPLSYLYEASRAAAGGGDAWELYLRWATACWQGKAATVLQELQQWQAAHPSPLGEKLPDTDPRTIVSKTVTYLTNNRERMNYPECRRQGLPVTSSLVESLIKELNYRVKGSEKFWNRPGGAEAILQIRTAALCDDRDRLSDWILNRPGCAFYRPSTAKRKSKSESTLATAT